MNVCNQSMGLRFLFGCFCRTVTTLYFWLYKHISGFNSEEELRDNLPQRERDVLIYIKYMLIHIISSGLSCKSNAISEAPYFLLSRLRDGNNNVLCNQVSCLETGTLCLGFLFWQEELKNPQKTSARRQGLFSPVFSKL